MKKRRMNIFGSKQRTENKQVKAVSENRISGILRNMSRGAHNIFKSLRPRGNWGSHAQHGHFVNKGGKAGNRAANTMHKSKKSD